VIVDLLGATPVIPGRRDRKTPTCHDRRRYQERWRIEATSGRLKDFRRVAARNDKPARSFLDAITLAAIYSFRL